MPIGAKRFDQPMPSTGMAEAGMEGLKTGMSLALKKRALDQQKTANASRRADLDFKQGQLIKKKYDAYFDSRTKGERKVRGEDLIGSMEGLNKVPPKKFVEMYNALELDDPRLQNVKKIYNDFFSSPEFKNSPMRIQAAIMGAIVDSKDFEFDQIPEAFNEATKNLRGGGGRSDLPERKFVFQQEKEVRRQGELANKLKKEHRLRFKADVDKFRGNKHTVGPAEAIQSFSHSIRALGSVSGDDLHSAVNQILLRMTAKDNQGRPSDKDLALILTQGGLENKIRNWIEVAKGKGPTDKNVLRVGQLLKIARDGAKRLYRNRVQNQARSMMEFYPGGTIGEYQNSLNVIEGFKIQLEKRPGKSKSTRKATLPTAAPISNDEKRAAARKALKANKITDAQYQIIIKQIGR